MVNTDLLKHINTLIQDRQDRYIEELKLAAIHTKSIHNYITRTSRARDFNSVSSTTIEMYSDKQREPQQQREPPVAAPGDLENLKGEVKTLQKALDILTKASVESILHRLLNFMASPLTEFNKYEALEMTEELQNAAHDRKHPKERYYRVVQVPDYKRENGDPTCSISCPFTALRVLEIVSKIDDSHNGQLQTTLAAGEYASLQTQDERRFAAAESAVFLVAFYLSRLGYFFVVIEIDSGSRKSGSLFRLSFQFDPTSFEKLDPRDAVPFP
ncbi:Hypothetical predicted protein [Paramuricea clavata]|uniref:Uncharacterized protein n=1 Tax=Paramuricea clavata TaxID=317549 RepID=A0A7D9HXS4_PARCT|nr:Hypothetical predicted protein [Paramuricea clavata]